MSIADQPGNAQNSLVGDLESLRLLLDATPRPAARDASNVPLLDDAIGEAIEDAIDETIEEANEGPPSEQVKLARRSAHGSALPDDTIKALLGDEWRESADKILSAAREATQSVTGGWSPQQTSELNTALRVRIDATLTTWLQAMIQQRLDDLRGVLIDAMESEIDRFTARLNQQEDDGK